MLIHTRVDEVCVLKSDGLVGQRWTGLRSLHDLILMELLATKGEGRGDQRDGTLLIRKS